jgi:cephalosporin-C deacetylase
MSDPTSAAPTASAAASAAEVPQLPSDEQLRGFWQASRERLATQPMEAQCTEAPGPLPYCRYRLDFRSLGGVPIRGYLSLPHETMVQGRLPAIVTTTGYGGRQLCVDLNESLRGYAILQLYPRGQGESGDLWKVDPAFQGNWLGCGAGQPEGYYYQGAFLDMVRGIDYLLTRADIDPERIGFIGMSQAGAIALATAAIDPRVRAVAAHVPFICDLRRNPKFTYPEAFHRTFDYFDPCRLAAWIQAPTLLSAGGADATSPAGTIHAVFNQLPGIKSLYHDPRLGHVTAPEVYAQQWAWMSRHLQRA